MDKTSIDYISNVIVERVPKIMSSHIKKIIIFGSCARGDFNEDSDMDVAFLVDQDRLSVKMYDNDLMNMVSDIAMETGENTEYICLPIDEFDEKKGWYGFFKNINTEGKVIYG